MILPCKIRVGKTGLKYPIAAMWRVADKEYPGGFGVDPLRFWCRDCKTTWGGYELTVGVDAKTVSCSNCYSDNITLTEIRFTRSMPKDEGVERG